LIAMQTLHDEKKIVHRDIKPENLLLHYRDGEPSPSLVLCDFGHAKHLPKKPDEYLFSQCGTPIYYPPEIVNGEAYREKADMWCIGCTVFVLLSGCQAFEGEDEYETFQYITTCDYSFQDPSWSAISDEAKHFIKNLLLLDGKERWSATRSLQNDWFAKHGVTPHQSTTAILDSKIYNVAAVKQYQKPIGNVRRKMKAAIYALRFLNFLECHDHDYYDKRGPLTKYNLPYCLLNGVRKAGIPNEICNDDEIFECNQKMNTDLIGLIRLPSYLSDEKYYKYQTSLDSEKSIDGVLSAIRSMVRQRELFAIEEQAKCKPGNERKEKNTKKMRKKKKSRRRASVMC